MNETNTENIEEKEDSAGRFNKSERSVRRYQSLIIKLIVFVVVIWTLLFVFIGITHMPSTDMHPKIAAGDLVMFYRLDKDVSAQDVIVIDKYLPDKDANKVYITRVVAVAGDTVEIKNGLLYINGDVMIEADIHDKTDEYDGYTEYPVTLGEDECFVLSDNRDGAEDSRYFGVVNKNEIVGTVFTILRRNNL